MDIRSLRRGDPLPPLQKTSLRLYSMRWCPYAQRTRMVLAHKNIPYETVNVDMNDKPDWYWARNPEGRVPILEQGGGHVIYESTATCEWLDDVYTHSRLTPADPYVKARDRMMLEYFSNITSLFYVKLRKPDTLEEGIVQLHKHYSHYEKELEGRGEGPFFGGSSPSMLDFYLWPHMERLPVLARRDPRISVTVTSHPRLAGWYGAMYNVRAVKETMLDHDTHDVFLRGWEAGKPDYDWGLH